MDISLNALNKREVGAGNAAPDNSTASTAVPENVAPDNAGTATRQFDEALQREMAHVLASPVFRKTPKLSQLLAYLVDATLRGDGETLKSYTVAVDGLGRDENFDAQADSYPRVQVLRLRNMLGLFYSRFEPGDGMCIYLLPGSYRVRLAKFSIAYPDTVGRGGRSRPILPPQDDAPAAAQDASQIAAVAAVAAEQHKQPIWHIAHIPMSLRTIAAGFALIVTALAVAFIISNPLSAPEAATGTAQRAPNEAPSILIAQVRAGSDPASTALAAEIQDAIEAGFAQSWLVAAHSGDGSPQQPAPTVRYRFASSLGKAGGTGRTVHFKLIDAADQQILWSQSWPIDTQRDIAPQLRAAPAAIVSAIGAIGRRETDLAKGAPLDGYGCLLAAHDPRADFLLPVRAATAKCLQTPIDNRRLEAVRLSAQALALLQGPNALPVEARLQGAEKLARSGMATAPSLASSYFAMAWAQYTQGNCAFDASPLDGAKAFAPRTFDSTALAALSAAATHCRTTDTAW